MGEEVLRDGGRRGKGKGEKESVRASRSKERERETRRRRRRRWWTTADGRRLGGKAARTRLDAGSLAVIGGSLQLDVTTALVRHSTAQAALTRTQPANRNGLKREEHHHHPESLYY